jgi:hypothetical protein
MAKKRAEKPPKNEQLRSTSQLIATRFPNHLLAPLQQMAEDRGVTRSKVIIRALEQLLIKEKYLDRQGSSLR